jgi:hypothetical protein
VGGFDGKSFFRGANLPGRGWHARAVIQQEATFWRRSLWERAGGYMDASYGLAGDFELWARFFRAGATLYTVDTPLAGIRKHGGQKTATRKEEYLAEAEEILRSFDAHPYTKAETLLRRSLWYGFGRRSLRRLPRSVGSVLARLHLLIPVKACFWDGEAWEVDTDYVM